MVDLPADRGRVDASLDRRRAGPRTRAPVQDLQRRRSTLRALLAAPAGLRLAVLAKEVLDPPVALRGEGPRTV